jgi:hypothetical protein
MQNKALFHINNKITDIFYLVDEFCKEFDKTKEGRVLNEKESKQTRNKLLFSDQLPNSNPERNGEQAHCITDQH